jgi:hypothetical protein
MNTVRNVKKVSLLFFIALGGIHILSTLLLARGYDTQTLTLINGTFDLPVIFVGILYAFTSMKLYLEEMGKDTKLFDLLAGILSGTLLLGAAFVNFFF